MGPLNDPIAGLALSLALILLVAKLGGHCARRVGQPAVLGELLAGVVLGNLALVGVRGVDAVRTDPAIDILASLGVLLLLFQVGLESTVARMMEVGLSSLLVAVCGVIGPFALGWGVGVWLLPEASRYTHLFLGAALTATSVGITARVLKDLGRARSAEARVILGAAVIDDVLGLVILAGVSGLIATANRGGTLSGGAIGVILAKAGLFLGLALGIGATASRRLFSLASRLQSGGVLLATGLAFCFALAWLAAVVGLAPIVGAFAAGLVLEDVHYQDFVDRGEHTLEELIEPVAAFLVPIFFVLMGMRTDLRAFAQSGVPLLAVALTGAAILGKQLAAVGVVSRQVDRLTVGLGMMPRGEVGLIFANLGLTLTIGGAPVVPPALFSAIVAMVVVTTLVTPPALAWRFGRLASTQD